MARRWTWPIGLSLGARVSLLEEALYKHFEDCAVDREQMVERFAKQDEQVLRLHRQNQESNAKTLEAVQQLQGSTSTFDAMMPAIRSGIEADTRREYRRKGAQRVAGAVLATLVTVSALIPLLQLLIGLRVSFKLVG